MILTNKDSTQVIIKCDCGCSGIELTSFEFSKDQPKEYFISVLLSAFYTEQNSNFHKIKNRVETTWNILRHGTHHIQDICLTEEDFKELKEVISRFK